MDYPPEAQHSVPTPAETTLLVLAGGQGSRMGGADKGLVEWQGRPLIQWVVEQNRELFGPLVISCNRNHDTYRKISNTIVSDKDQGFSGPTAGILAAIPELKTPWTLVLPCDTPRLTGHTLEPLFLQAAHRKTGIFVAHDGKQLQPLVFLAETSALLKLSRAACDGERAIHRCLRYAGFEAVNCGTEDDFQNMNSPADLRLTSAEKRNPA